MISHESIAAGVAEFEALGNGLTGQRHRRFVLEYVADPKRNATRAYANVWERAADDTSRVNASKLLQNTNISAAIKALEAKVRDSALDRILNKLEAIIHAELSDVMEWNSDGQIKLVPSAELSPASSAALSMITEIKEEQQSRLPGLDDAEDVTINKIRKSIKMHDPLRAMEIFAKLAGVGGAERIEISGISDRLERARAASMRSSSDEVSHGA